MPGVRLAEGLTHVPVIQCCYRERRDKSPVPVVTVVAGMIPACVLRTIAGPASQVVGPMVRARPAGPPTVPWRVPGVLALRPAITSHEYAAKADARGGG